MDENYKIDEKKWYKFWMDHGCFSSKIDHTKTPYCIVIPPPNCTGNLHIGHALNNMYQDILIRTKKLQGFNTLWIPGTDHGGIATQNVVERELLKRDGGKTKEEIGRTEFLKKVWDWKETKSGNIIEQLKALGCACDWEREQFTMSKKLSKNVNKTFSFLHDKGLIYRGNYIVNWCPRCETAISDDEVEHSENEGILYYVQYFVSPEKDLPNLLERKTIIIATTRPETILGDSAVAYNPTDERFTHLRGKKVIVPIVNREVELIEDEYVKKEFGTGFVKITPCHDKNDYKIGKSHNLQFINVIDGSGVIENTNTKYDGMDRFECRKQIVEDLREQGFLEKEEKYNNSVGHCYRCKTVIESRVSDQWFVKMEGLMKDGIDCVLGDDTTTNNNSLGDDTTNNENNKNNKNNDVGSSVDLIPSFHKDIYKQWMTSNIDWCISRQIWWGHQIPIWYCENRDCGKYFCGEQIECDKCGGAEFRRETDVLDTWFSSALWAFSVFDNDEELEYYFPSNTLVTGSDILFFWVARMIMMTKAVKHDIPFKNVYLHGVVRDENGVKMSKSLGNVIDPMDIINKEGGSADILRFTLAYETPYGQDVNIGQKSFDVGKTFCTKLWNSVRYVLMNIDKDYCVEGTEGVGGVGGVEGVEEDNKKNKNTLDLDNTDKWILNKLNETIRTVTASIEKFDFASACKKLYEFLWEHFCPIYLEYAKTKIDETETTSVLLLIIDNLLRLLHPFIPFLTEKIFQITKNFFTKYNAVISIMETEWPKFIKFDYNEKCDAIFSIHQSILKSIRKIRSEYNVDKKEHTNRLVNIVIDICARKGECEGESKGESGEEIIDYLRNNDKPIRKLGKVNEILYNEQHEKCRYVEDYFTTTLNVRITVKLEVDERFDFSLRIAKLQKIITQKNNKIDKMRLQLSESTTKVNSKKSLKKIEELKNIEFSIKEMEKELSQIM